MNSYSSEEELVRNEFPELIQTLNRSLDFARWGFELNHSGILPGFPPCIIFRSLQCQVRFAWRQDRPYEDPAIHISYARLHALPNQEIMVWQGESCWCWHLPNLMLNFLDGLAACDVNIDTFVEPAMVREFRGTNRNRNWSFGEFAAREQALIWEHYGNRFFDSFDLQRPELWEAYTDFVREYYAHVQEQAEAKGIKPFVSSPPLHKIC